MDLFREYVTLEALNAGKDEVEDDLSFGRSPKVDVVGDDWPANSSFLNKSATVVPSAYFLNDVLRSSSNHIKKDGTSTSGIPYDCLPLSVVTRHDSLERSNGGTFFEMKSLIPLRTRVWRDTLRAFSERNDSCFPRITSVHSRTIKRPRCSDVSVGESMKSPLDEVKRAMDGAFTCDDATVLLLEFDAKDD